MLTKDHFFNAAKKLPTINNIHGPIKLIISIFLPFVSQPNYNQAGIAYNGPAIKDVTPVCILNNNPLTRRYEGIFHDE